MDMRLDGGPGDGDRSQNAMGAGAGIGVREAALQGLRAALGGTTPVCESLSLLLGEVMLQGLRAALGGTTMALHMPVVPRRS